MLWSAAPGAGFTTGEPWLPIDPSFATRNVEAQKRDPDSILNLYRTILRLRRTQPALSIGSFAAFDAGQDLYAFIREHGTVRFLVLLNLSNQPRLAGAPSHAQGWRALLSTRPERKLGREGAEPLLLESGSSFQLQPDEGLVLVSAESGVAAVA